MPTPHTTSNLYLHHFKSNINRKAQFKQVQNTPHILLNTANQVNC